MKNLSVLLFALLVSIVAKAQDSSSLALNLYGGYTFSDKVEYDPAYGYVEDGFQYGLGLEYFLAPTHSIELKYLRMDTDMPLYGPAGTQLNAGDDKGAINLILLGGTVYFGSSEQTALPYLGGGVGVGIVETPQSGNGTHFAWDIKTGVKIQTGSVVSINLNAYLQSITAAVGDSYYYTYYGIVELTDYVATYQFGLGVVLSFNFE